MGKTFLNNPELYTDINHKNGIKTDNMIENLEWCSRRHNILHAFRMGLTKNIAETHPFAKLNNNQVLDIYHSELSFRELGNMYSVNATEIYRIKTGQRWVSITKQTEKIRIPMKRKTFLYNGEERFLKDICEEIGISYIKVYMRIYYLHFPFDKAISKINFRYKK